MIFYPTHDPDHRTRFGAAAIGALNLSVQAFPEFNLQRARELVARFGTGDGPMLPVLHELQAEFGYIDRLCIPIIAETLNVSQAEVHGVVSFYHDFRTAPASRNLLKICRAESCQALGCETLVRHLEVAHGLRPGGSDEGREISVENVYCLGLCAVSPACHWNGEPVGRLNADRIDELLATVPRRAR